MNHILLLLDHRENRRLLAEWLGHKYQVIPNGEEALGGSFDLGILDGPALDRLWERVQARKEAEQPVFLPILLVTPRRDVRYVTRHLWRTVDELILTPLEKVELQARVEILLRARQLSLQLQAETIEQLRTSEERYRHISEVAFDYLYAFRVEPDGTMHGEWVSDSFVRVFGYTIPQIDARGGWQTIVHPDDLPIALEHAQKVVAGQSDICEMRFVTRDGEARWLRDYAKPVFDEAQERVVRIYGASQDITKRKRAEEALQRRAREAAALHSLTHRVSSSLSLDQVVAVALDEIAAAADPDLTLLFTRKGDDLLLQGFGPKDTGFAHEETPVHRVGECLCGLAVRQSRSIYSRDIHHDSRCTWEECKRVGLRSFVALPLRSGEEIIGVVGLASATERDFEAQATFLETLANEVAVGLQNARLYAEVQRHAAELEQRLAELRRARAALQESEARFRGIVEQSVDGISVTDERGLIRVWNRSLEQITGLTADEMVGKPIWDAQFQMLPAEQQTPERYRELKAGLEAFLHTGEAPWAGQLLDREYIRPDGARLFLQGVVFPVKTGKDFMLVSITRDITEQRQTAQALQRSLEETAHTHRLLLALSQAAQAVQRARTLEEVYRTVGQQVARLGYHAAIFTLTDDRSHLSPSYLSYEPAELQAAEKLAGLSAKGYRFPIRPGGLYQRIISERKTVFSKLSLDLIAEALPAGLRPLADWLAELLELKQSVIAPLSVGDEMHGLLAVTGPDLTEADVPAISTFANQAAIALENARLLESERQQREQLRALTTRLAEVEEEERRRLARELHDRVGQNLTSLSISLSTVRSLLPPETTPQVVPYLDGSITLVEETAELIRDVMGELRPAVLDDYGLLAALQWHGQRFSEHTGLPVLVQGEELAPRLPSTVETALFRIAQEALTNVAKHAQASQVTVTLESVDGGARLTIADDGIGFDPAARHHTGWGLITMRERAETAGGHLRVESIPGEGTRIVVEVPR